MILVDRGPEPAALVRARAKHLPALQKIVAGGRDPLSTEIKGYGEPEIRKALWEAQHKKCCYCEKPIEQTREDVEHYRPKAEANRAPGSPLKHGYWWLAFTWENLLYSCPQCNQPPAKGVHFPLERGCTVLVAEQAPPEQERPLLVDPGRESGVACIQFQRKRKLPGDRLRWIPVPRNDSEKGRETIRVCCLDRDPLLDRYDKHVIEHVMPVVRSIRDAMGAEDGRGVWNAFQTAVRKLLVPRQQFVGLSYDALVHHVKDADLSRYKLAWPIPS